MHSLYSHLISSLDGDEWKSEAYMTHRSLPLQVSRRSAAVADQLRNRRKNSWKVCDDATAAVSSNLRPPQVALPGFGLHAGGLGF